LNVSAFSLRPEAKMHARDKGHNRGKCAQRHNTVAAALCHAV
jgi:hypothetical protein